MERAPRPAQDFEFGDVRVEAGAHRLLRHGAVVAVEPKAFAVLLELLAQPGQLVARDALLDAVWGHRHVTPAVLNRVIAMLRKAIGDDADAPQYIETVHGLGYRFAAPLHAGAGPAPAVAGVDAAPPVPLAPPVTSAPATPAGAAHNAAAVAPATIPHALPVATRRPLLLFALVAVLASGWLLWRQSRIVPVTVVVPPHAESVDRSIDANAKAPAIAVLPLRVAPSEPDTRAVADGLVESIGEMLDRLASVRVSGRDSVAIAVARDPDPRASGRLVGADYVLHGDLAVSADDSMALDLALLRVADGVTVWTSAYQQPRDQLFRVMGPTLAGVQGLLRPAAPLVSDALIRADDSAQELYWRARQLLQPRRAEATRQAIGLLEQALAIDPQFGLAYCSLAIAWRNSAMSDDVDLQASIARAQAALARALEIDPALMCAHLGMAYLLTLQWRAPLAQAPIARALQLDPDNVDALSLAANLLVYQGRPREALAMHERVQALDPLSPAPKFMRWYELVHLGRGDEALANLRSGIAGFPPQRSLAPRVLLANGRIAEAARSLAAFGGDAGTDIFVRLSQVTTDAALGDLDAAAATMAKIPEGRSRAPIYGEVRARLFWQRGAYMDSLAWIESADGVLLAEPWRRVLRGHARALAGDEAGALADYEAGLASESDRLTVAHSWYPLHFGLGELANRAALRASQGLDAGPARDDYGRILAGMVEGGVDLPAIDYLQALGAALDDDAITADRHLGRALERGWRDPIALDIDLPWRPYRGTAWLQARRAQLAAHLDAERAALAGNAGASPPADAGQPQAR